MRPALRVVTGCCAGLALAASIGACSGASSGSSSSSGSSGSSSSSSSSAGGPAPTPTSGCGTTPPRTGYLGAQKLAVSGSTRTYELTLPKAFDGNKAYPLILVFHGDGGSGAGIRGNFDLETASADGAVIAYPDGEGATWKLDDMTSATSDLAFVDALIASLQKTYCTDKARVFLTGYSSGAYFANQVACRTRSALKGVVTFAGGGPYGIGSSEFDGSGNLVCPAPPVAALQVHGDADTTVDVTEGHKSRDHWRRVNECQASTTPTSPSPCEAYDGCKRPEVWCLVPGLGHVIWGSGVGAKVTWGFFESL